MRNQLNGLAGIQNMPKILGDDQFSADDIETEEGFST